MNDNIWFLHWLSLIQKINTLDVPGIKGSLSRHHLLSDAIFSNWLNL